jgi:hypothetical protein
MMRLLLACIVLCASFGGNTGFAEAQQTPYVPVHVSVTAGDLVGNAIASKLRTAIDESPDFIQSSGEESHLTVELVSVSNNRLGTNDSSSMAVVYLANVADQSFPYFLMTEVYSVGQLKIDWARDEIMKELRARVQLLRKLIGGK